MRYLLLIGGIVVLLFPIGCGDYGDTQILGPLLFDSQSTEQQYPNQILCETFESGQMNSEFQSYGNASWMITSSDANNGYYSICSGSIDHSQTSGMMLSIYVTGEWHISFWYKVSSEQGFDKLKFYINNTVMGVWSGNVGWSTFSQEVSYTGSIQLAWIYDKDGSQISGSDKAWIDDIEIFSR